MEKNKLKQQTLSSMFWKFMERIFAQGITFIVTIVLARILTPDDYSIVSIITVFFAFCNIIITGGLNTSLIRKKNPDILDYSTVFFFSLGIATILYVVIFCVAPQIARIYNKPLLIHVFRVMGVIFFIYAVKSVIYAYVAHNLMFRMFFGATICGTLISAMVGIIMAIKGFGPWALIAQQLTNNTIDLLLLLMITKLKIKPIFSLSCLKYHLNYSWKILVTSLIGTLYNEIKPLIIGIRYSTTDLAYYNKGDNFPTLINTTISNTMSSVLFSSLSKLQDDKPLMLAAVRRYIKLSSYVMFPAMIGLALVAETLVSCLLTDKWLPAVPFLRIFCVVYMFDLIHVGNLHAIKALGRTDISLKLEVIKKTIYFAMIFVFVLLSKSTIIFALCNLVCSLVGTIVDTYPNRKLLGYKYRYQFEDIANNLLCTFLMSMVVYAMHYLPIYGLNLLIIQVAIGGCSYILFSCIFRNDNLKYIVNMLQELVKSRK